jgi:hypothetical protein
MTLFVPFQTRNIRTHYVLCDKTKYKETLLLLLLLFSFCLKLALVFCFGFFKCVWCRRRDRRLNRIIGNQMRRPVAAADER